MARRILVVEDEALIADAVAARLRSEGYDVEVARDGPSGVDMAREAHADLVVLDLMLPGLDGLEVCRRIQKDRHVPVLMLTARDDETDLVVGLAVGADDYLTKPFSMRELVARVQAILRRVDAVGGPDAGQVIRVDEIEVDVDARRVHRAGTLVHLTPTEFDLLVCLAERPGRVLTRERLLLEVWGYRDGSGARTVDSHVRALRRKLGDGVVRTVHGVGYGLGDPSDTDTDTDRDGAAAGLAHDVNADRA
ncbi:MAG: DNA-binding response regulator [Acidimicrobiales bacterium]|nr:DNA-binding response regulator [Acidimicrobiales bacterium]